MRDALQVIPMFKALDDEDLDLIATRLKHVSYAKDETILNLNNLETLDYTTTKILIEWKVKVLSYNDHNISYNAHYK